MSNSLKHRLTRPETMTALCIIAAAVAFLFPTAKLQPISALLPATMLVGLIVLAAILIVTDQRKANAGVEAEPMMTAPKRVLGAFALIVGYALATQFLGFYPSTAIAVPLVAYIFGYRKFLGLAAATIIVVGAIYLIFDVAMAQSFPSGLIWR